MTYCLDNFCYLGMEVLYLYGQIGKGPNDSPDEQVITASWVAEQLKAHKGRQLDIRIMSPGGDVTEGWAIHDLLKACNKHVTMYADGLVASAAATIFMAGHERIMMPNAKLLIHNPWGRVEGDAKQVQQYSANLKAEESRMCGLYSKVSGADPKIIQKLMDKDEAMTAERAVELGLATKVADAARMVAFLKSAVKMGFFSKNKKEEKKSTYAVISAEGIKGAIEESIAELEEGAVLISDGEEMGEGVAIYVALPANMSPYTLSDGRIVETDEMGVITSISEAAEASEETEASVEQPDIAALVAAEVAKALAAAKEGQDKALSEAQETLNALEAEKEALKAEAEAAKAMVDKLEKEPVTPKIQAKVGREDKKETKENVSKLAAHFGAKARGEIKAKYN